MKYKHAIIFIVLILLIGLTGCFLFPPTNNTAEWTIMIYLDSDNTWKVWELMILMKWRWSAPQPM